MNEFGGTKWFLLLWFTVIVRVVPRARVRSFPSCGIVLTGVNENDTVLNNKVAETLRSSPLEAADSFTQTPLWATRFLDNFQVVRYYLYSRYFQNVFVS